MLHALAWPYVERCREIATRTVEVQGEKLRVCDACAAESIRYGGVAVEEGSK